MYIFDDILEFSIYRRFDHFLHSFCALCVVFRVLMIFIFIDKALIFAQLDSYLHLKYFLLHNWILLCTTILKYFFAQLDSFFILLCAISI